MKLFLYVNSEKFMYNYTSLEQQIPYGNNTPSRKTYHVFLLGQTY